MLDNSIIKENIFQTLIIEQVYIIITLYKQWNYHHYYLDNDHC